MATCHICKHAGTPSYKSPCSECKGFSKYEYEKSKTNSDRIRSMSDYELAKFIDDKCVCPPASECPKVCGGDCVDCWLEWLQQPAERG